MARREEGYPACVKLIESEVCLMPQRGIRHISPSSGPFNYRYY